MSDKVVKALNLGKNGLNVFIRFCFINCVVSDANSQRKFINFYNQKFNNEDSSTCFRIFDRGEYYSIHGRDVEIALKTKLKSSIVVKMMKPDELPGLKYASMNKSIFEKLLRELLLVVGYKVEIYTSNKGDWAIEFKGSPGNLAQFEDLLFSSSEPEILR
jgi:DNA mismatch repair protein MSH2